MTVDLQAGTAEGEGSDQLVAIEGIEGSAFDDDLLGDGGNNQFFPGVGDDSVDGGAGIADMVDYFFSETGVNVDLSAGTATGDGTDDLVGVEGVWGSDFADTIIGDAGDNLLYGWKGGDILSGGEGDDEILGQGGADSLDGGIGIDALNGGPGSDACVNGEATQACES